MPWDVCARAAQIRLWGCGLVVVFPSGERSLNCVHDLGPQGCLLTLSRHLNVVPLPPDTAAAAAPAGAAKGRGGRPPPLPAMQTHVEVALLDVRITDTQYHTGLGILYGALWQRRGRVCPSPSCAPPVQRCGVGAGG